MKLDDITRGVSVDIKEVPGLSPRHCKIKRQGRRRERPKGLVGKATKPGQRAQCFGIQVKCFSQVL